MFLSFGNGYIGELLELLHVFEAPSKFKRKGVVFLQKPHWERASSRLEGRTSWIFSSCGWFLSSYNVYLRTHSCGLRKGQSPCELRGASRDPLQSVQGPKTSCLTEAGT